MTAARNPAMTATIHAFRLPRTPAECAEVEHDLKELIAGQARIEERVQTMYAQGLLREMEGLLARYPALSATARQAIGYAEAINLLEGRCSRDEAMARTAARTRQLAKRQRTWFRGERGLEWRAPVAADVAAEAAEFFENLRS